eukprot:NODE_1108_length_1281_cov_54.853896_g907_i0.p1 GENE.NODE_1108_length_1281_cov_54.853896_g907_i0~~NODE_1108_length_1281_cov_54.853896_g907_i0.p1  ORF type:complete len:208 (-),score=33.15 NODE_1108_length_1281_cov_54.853896_g907_i0:79-702(-)
MLAARYIATNTSAKRVYVIGQEGFKLELKAFGIEVCSELDNGSSTMSHNELDALDISSVDGVVCAWDNQFCYRKQCIANAVLMQPPKGNGLPVFICSNMDSGDKTLGGRLMPMTGTMAAAIQVGSGVKPVCTGKPSALIVDQLIEMKPFRRDRACMIGDRIDTDIALGAAAGITSVHVATGVSPHSSDSGATYNLSCFGALIDSGLL